MRSHFCFVAVGGWLGLVPVTIWAQGNMNGWQVKDEKLILSAADGSVQKEIELGASEKTRSPKEKIMWERHETTAATSLDGQYAFVRKYDSSTIAGMRSSIIMGTYYGPDGKELWQRRKVGQYWISDDGKFVLLTIDEPEGCNSEEGCTESVVSINQIGREILKLGPYGDTVAVWLSPNHRYAHIAPPGGVNIFCDIAKKKPAFMFKLNEMPGTPIMDNDGTVKFEARYFEGTDSKGVPIVTRSEIVRTLKIK